jgi:hypothetical protein
MGKEKETMKIFKAGPKPVYVRDNATLEIYEVIAAPYNLNGANIYALIKIGDQYPSIWVGDNALINYTWGDVTEA